MAGNDLSKAAQRIQQELKEIIETEKISKNGISVEIVDDNLLNLKGIVMGPPDTPYEGGAFILEIKVPDFYPFFPLKMRFVTKIWHPNIDSGTGEICLNILKSDWTPCLTLRTVLLSIQALLAAAEPDDPQDGTVAEQFIENPSMFKLTAEHWTRVYAGASGHNKEFEDKIKILTDKGVDEETALRSLSSFFWDVKIATEVADFVLRNA